MLRIGSKSGFKWGAWARANFSVRDVAFLDVHWPSFECWASDWCLPFQAWTPQAEFYDGEAMQRGQVFHTNFIQFLFEVFLIA